MPLRLHRISDCPSPEDSEPLASEVEDDEPSYDSLYDHLTTLITALLRTNHALITLHSERQSLESLRPTVPATSPLGAHYDDIVERVDTRIVALLWHAVELEETIERIEGALVEMLAEELRVQAGEEG